MDVKVEKLPKSSVKITVAISPIEMGAYFSQATNLVADQVNVPGFRKGKAPKSVLESRLGKDSVTQQALELAVSQSYYDAVKQHNLKPIGRPQTDLSPEQIDKLETAGLRYTATVAVLPAIDLGRFREVKVKPASSNYQDSQVDEALAQLRKSRASMAQVDRAAARGDQVEIDFVGMHQGKELPGGKSTNHPLVIGEDSFVPGFADELVGMKQGQVKKFKLKFPKDYHQPSLSDAKVEFTVTMKSVKAVTLPPLDEQFAKQFGASSANDLRKRLTANLKKEKELEAQRQTEETVVMKVVDGATLEVPEPLVDEEVDRMMAEFRQQVERQGLSFEQYLGHLKKSEADIRAEQRPEAVRRVKISLVLNDIQQREKIKPSAKDIAAEIKHQLEQAPDEQAKERINSDDFRQYVTRVLGNRQVVARLVKRATG